MQVLALQFVDLLLRLSEVLQQLALLGLQLVLGLLGIVTQLLISIQLRLRSYDAVLQRVQLLFGLLQLELILVDHLVVVFWLVGESERGFRLVLVGEFEIIEQST